MEPDDIITYPDLCREEGLDLTDRLNYRIGGDYSVIRMDSDPDGSYEDCLRDDGCSLVLTGHDVPALEGGPEPKTVDQPMLEADGALSQNGLFFQAAKEALGGDGCRERVRIYEKTKDDTWVYRGLFELLDAWTKPSTPDGGRRVFRFSLSICPANDVA
jgi:hypothetical protein